jgi:hypothetical protein
MTKHKCAICKKEFEENEIETSHDIPKYLGGTDLDGRHLLCKPCHEKYEFKILYSCILKILWKEIYFSKDKRSYIPYMTKLKDNLFAKDITIKIQKETYKNENNNS